MLNVFITIDTECWPRERDWRETGLRSDVRREIFGDTPEGEFGIGYQMRVLNEHGLRGVFFVEALFATAVGVERLAEIVSAVRQAGHEVQLHIHPEWLAWTDRSPLPGRTGQNMKDFSEDEQALLIDVGLANLRASGASDVCAFRAGNYGADFNTLRALARQGIKYDTSYNAGYLDTDCGMRTHEVLLQPREILGVVELPVSHFTDWPGHVRHTQLCACSATEMEGALLAAWRQGWTSFVIVAHSFELLKRRKSAGLAPLPDRVVIRRFERLCRFLADHRDQFQVRGFAGLAEGEMLSAAPVRPLRSPLRRTVSRFAEQAYRRALAGASR